MSPLVFLLLSLVVSLVNLTLAFALDAIDSAIYPRDRDLT